MNFKKPYEFESKIMKFMGPVLGSVLECHLRYKLKNLVYSNTNDKSRA